MFALGYRTVFWLVLSLYSGQVKLTMYTVISPTFSFQLTWELETEYALKFLGLSVDGNALYFSRLESAVPLILREMKKPDMTNVSVAFPDEGAFKRFHSMFEKDFPLITCIKIREGGRRNVKIKEGRACLMPDNF